jgi:hypothetical protein
MYLCLVDPSLALTEAGIEVLRNNPLPQNRAG